MYRISVGSDVANSTHDISLSDGTTEVGLIVCNSSGDHDPYNISRNPISRMAMKTTSGSQKHGDMEPPWMPIAQEDFRGGRGLEDVSEDPTRYYDSFRAQTGFKEIINGALEYYSDGYRNAVTNYPGSVSWLKLQDGASKYIAVSFSAGATFEIGQLYLLIRKRGEPKTPLKIELCSNNAGAPGTKLFGKDFVATDFRDTVSEFRKFVLSGVNLISGMTYYIKIYTEETGENDYWQVGINKTTGTTSYSADNILWKPAPYDLYYRVTDKEIERTTKFFTYKYLKFAIQQTGSGVPRLYVNGTLGTADDNSGALNQLIDSSKTWGVDYWKGAMVGIIGGLGYEEPSVYRNIVSNIANRLTVDIPFTIPQDITTQYAIFNTPHWIEIPASMHGLTGRVTDICVVNDIIYFAQGDRKPVRRMRWSIAGNDGGWVSENEQYNAMYLEVIRHRSRGLEIWRAQNEDKNKAVSVSRASVIDWLGNSMTLLNQTEAVTAEKTSAGVDFMQGDDVALQYKMTIGTIAGEENPSLQVRIEESDDNVVFTPVKNFQLADAAGTYYLACRCTKRHRRVWMKPYGKNPSFNNITIVTENNLRFAEPLSFHDSYGKINKIIEYSEGTIKNLWIMREGMVFTVKTDERNDQADYVDPMSLPELNTVMEENNGTSSITSNVYLYFTLGNGIQRYYNQKLDSDGPDKDAGLPPERQGMISSMLGYPGRYFAAVDAGRNGYSSILMNNNAGWHEIYRAPNKGERIHDMTFQAIPTGIPDRLWFSCGDDLLWLVMPSKTLNAVYDPEAEYTHESTVISSWHTGGMADITKTWNSLKVISDELDGDEILIEADYQTDEDLMWHPLPDVFVKSPSHEILFVKDFAVQGKRLRYRLRLQTSNKKRTARIKTTVIEAIGIVDIKYSFGFSYRNLIGYKDLIGQEEMNHPDELQSILDHWASTGQALKMRSNRKLFDHKRVYLEAPKFRTGKELEEGYIGTLNANEI